MGSLLRRYLAARVEVGLGWRILWWFMPITATVTVVVVLGWGVPILLALIGGEPSPKYLHGNAAAPGFLIVHVIMGALAILIGLLQLLKWVRADYPWVHRWLGRTYVALVLPSSLACLALAPRVETYGVPLALSSMGVLWFGFTVLGFWAIRRGDVARHREWMLRSFALTWAGGVLFRIFMGIGKLTGTTLATNYPVSVWLAIALCLLFAEYCIWSSKPKGDRGAPRQGTARADA